MNQIAPARPHDSSPRCARCSHALEATPRMIAGLPFGPECAKHAAMLEAHLVAHSLTFPVTLPLEPTPDGGWRRPEVALSALSNRAGRAGLTVALEYRWQLGTVTVALEPLKKKGFRALEDAARPAECPGCWGNGHLTTSYYDRDEGKTLDEWECCEMCEGTGELPRTLAAAHRAAWEAAQGGGA